MKLTQTKHIPLIWLMCSLASLSLAADKDKPGQAAAKPSLTVSIATVQTEPLPIRLSANGAVAAWQEAIVGAEISGLRVQELHANVGDTVRKGQLLASFSADTVQADVALARANLAEAVANAAESAANAERARSLQSTGAMSGQQINQYLTQEQTGKARVESAKAQLDTQLLRLKQTQLLAPDDGIISARNVTVGSVAAAGGEMYRLIRRGRLEWRGEVSSSDLERVKPGQKVLLTSAAGAQWRGSVRMLAPTVDVATRKGLVYVDMQGVMDAGKAAAATSTLKPGMYVRGDFELGTSPALTVPQTAVVVRDGFSYVYRVGADNRVAQLKVQTGRLSGNRLELLGGIAVNERVVASGGGFLADGDLVRVVDASAAVAK
jgi:HlyD family secretion protein